MRIVSTPLPAAPEDLTDQLQTIVMALDTLVGDKSLVVGLLQGSLTSNRLEDLKVSPTGQIVLSRSGFHHRRAYPDGPVIVAGVANVRNAAQRVRDVLAKAPSQALVLLVCANGKVYDAAFDALGIDFGVFTNPRQ